ncbi:MAG: hypothetical protein KF755_04730 [Burkholderiaceae bacterium]|nr:hypothetical protein [Burkholderiaceae bacterium]
MAKPNYAFAKRQRELAKKQKKEEKLKRKAEQGTQGEAPDEPEGAADDVAQDQPKGDQPSA